jgi:hypothetical protein
MEWLPEYRGYSDPGAAINLSSAGTSKYDIETAGINGTPLTLQFKALGAAAEEKEMGASALAALTGKFQALSADNPLTVTHDSSNGDKPTYLADDNYTTPPSTVTSTLGGVPVEYSGGTITVTALTGAEAAFTSIPSELSTAITGDVTIDFDDLSGEMPLTWFHCARAALSGKTVTFSNTGNVVPVYTSSDWYLLDWNTDELLTDLFTAIPAGTVIMPGIVMTTDSSDGKKVLEYNRAIKADHAPYGVFVPEFDYLMTFHGFGIRQISGGSITPAGGKTWDQIMIGGVYYLHFYGQDSDSLYLSKGRAADWADYLTALKESGLSRVQNPDGSARADLSTAPYPAHNIGVNWGSVSNNIVQNGAYDFILAHYNLKAAGGVDGDDRSSSIDDISWSGGTFDGKNAPPAGFPARKVNIAGSVVPLDSLDRKTSSGNINNVFYGSLNTAMARYLQSNLSVAEFKNANIYGDANQWNGGSITDWPGTPNFTNVALVGSYNGTSISTTVKGVLDIAGNGSPSQSILNNTRGGYLNFIGNVGTTNIRYSNFTMLDVTKVNSNDAKIGAANSTNGDAPDVTIYKSKTQATNVPYATDSIPNYYRAFENASGTRKYALSSFGSPYNSPTNPSGNVPNLSRDAWENAAPNAPATINASGNVWSNISDLEN